jgi:F-type H+-transporting ATPase subunit b
VTSRLPAILFALLPALALAAEEHHGEQHGVPWGTLLLSTINVLIFFWVLKRFAWPALASWVKDRRSEVVKALEAAAQAKQEADRLKLEWEQRVANLAQETEAMRRQARLEIERERDQILAAAQKTAATIRDDARRLADHEVRQAQAKLRDEVARQAFEIARKMTAERVTGTDQARFVDEFVDRVNA